MEHPSSSLTDREVEYWDSFFRARNGRPIEWYCDWADLQGYLSMLVPKSKSTAQILVAGCGNSELSAHMYDVGWQSIINIDFSKMVIAEMLRLHVRSRPLMRWQVMDITHLQFADACFDMVLDKGSLDVLMGEEVTERSLPAINYLSEVKRVLRPGGKYACVTRAQNNVLGLLLESFRQGWLLNVHKILMVSKRSDPQCQPYLVYAIKSSTEDLAPVKCVFGNNQNLCSETQMQYVVDAIKEENSLRSIGGFINTSDVFGQLHQGRRTPLKLGGHYPAVVLDAKPDSEPPALRCGVFLVPKSRAHEWLFSSEEGQWQVIETAQAGRLILVTLDAQQTDNMDFIKQELSPFVKPLLPLDCRDSDTIPYMTTNDARSQRVLLEEIESPMTGTIHVEELMLLREDSLASRAEDAKPKQYRRLVFRRNPNLIQSEASLIPVKVQSKERDRAKNGADVVRRHSGNKKKHKAKDAVLGPRTGYEEVRVDFSYLASEYHEGMISGLSLIAHNLEQWMSANEPIRAMIVGLGAGLLPMFVHNHIPVDTIQVVELDGVVGDVAKRHFGFVENERMQLCIADGAEAVGAIARNTSTLPRSYLLEANISSWKSTYTSNKFEKLHILIIDADSEDPSTGLSCPPAEFLEEPFFRSAREALVEGGILAINVVSRASSPHITSVALLQKVFEEVYVLEIEEHVNRVLFALPHQGHQDGQTLAEVAMEEARTFDRITSAFAPWENGPSVVEYVKKLKRLK